MLFITTYKVNPYITKAETAELMEVFAKQGSAPGEIAHYVNADGGGGVVISDTADMAGSYRNNLNYAEWLEFDTTLVLTVDQAVPHILDAIA